MRRMDRYRDEETTEKLSRSNKNKDLYQNVGTNTRYANITDVTNTNAIDITNTTTEYKTREDYQKMKKYGGVETPKVKRDLEEFNHIYNKHENRVYDINNVLEEARKNREEDTLEEKRKLKNTSYNILASLNKEELEKFRQEKRDRLFKDDEELRDLIDTIASKTLAGEIEAASDLLSDLMATSIIDKKALKETMEETEDNDEDDEDSIIIEKEEIIITTEPSEDIEDDEVEETEEPEVEEENEDDELSLSQKILDKEQIEDLKRYQEQLAQAEDTTEEETEPETEVEKDETFYTRSMDLSEEDFDLDSEFNNKKTPTFIKVLIIIILLVAIAISVYFLRQYL